MEHNVKVKVLADSIPDFSNNDVRLTTLQLRYPRIVHAELMTHRVFSRNSGSSRAKPVLSVLKDDIFIPETFKNNKKGMQPGEPLSLEKQKLAEELWYNAYEEMAETSRKLKELGVHKQWANRITEPFGYIDVIVTSTDWENFDKLRDHGDAQDEIKFLAQDIKRKMNESYPKKIQEWHLPYITESDYCCDGFRMKMTKWNMLKRMSVARCARVSYKPFDESTISLENWAKELELADRLQNSQHWSPFEHIAKATPNGILKYGNFRGWKSYRAELQNQQSMIPISNVLSWSSNDI